LQHAFSGRKLAADFHPQPFLSRRFMPPKDVVFASWLCLLGLPQSGLLLMEHSTIGSISLLLFYLLIALWCAFALVESKPQARYVWLSAWLVFVPIAAWEIVFDPGWIGTFATTYMIFNLVGLTLTATPAAKWWFLSWTRRLNQ